MTRWYTSLIPLALAGVASACGGSDSGSDETTNGAAAGGSTAGAAGSAAGAGGSAGSTGGTGGTNGGAGGAAGGAAGATAGASGAGGSAGGSGAGGKSGAGGSSGVGGTSAGGAGMGGAGGTSAGGTAGSAGAAGAAGAGGAAGGIQTVFLIVMENHNWSQIKAGKAPYIKSLLPLGAFAENYKNPPGNHPSLPNYIWFEAGSALGISNDANPSANHQKTDKHLARLLKDANISWRAYQEDISGADCPLVSVKQYAPKHNPFVYFDDMTATNTKSDPYCIAHNRPYTELASDLANDKVARYNFITPNLCNDMHDSCAPTNDSILQGDTWLAAEVPKILASAAYKNNGALFITWDEAASGDGPIGMIVLSPLAKVGYSGKMAYTHSSTLRTMQEIFGVTPLLGDAANAATLSDLFTQFP